MLHHDNSDNNNWCEAQFSVIACPSRPVGVSSEASRWLTKTKTTEEENQEEEENDDDDDGDYSSTNVGWLSFPDFLTRYAKWFGLGAQFPKQSMQPNSKVASLWLSLQVCVCLCGVNQR